MNLFKGYLPTSGRDGKTPTESYKNRTEFYSLEQVQILESYGGVLNNEIIQIDVDDEDNFNIVLNITQELLINTSILKTSRGGHFYFLNTKIEKRSQGFSTPLGIKIDTGLGSQNAVIPLKIHGELRKWIRESDKLDELPSWLFPITKQTIDFKGMCEGDGRNSTLFSYILSLQQAGLSKDQIKDSIRIINQFILQDPVNDRELDTILRDSAFLKESFYLKGKLQYEKLARFMIANEDVIKINNQLHIYRDGYYSCNLKDIERKLLSFILNSLSSNRGEVIKYMDILLYDNIRQSSPKLIVVNNGVLDIETKILYPYDSKFIIKNKINVNYNPNAYNEALDKTLNKICCNDKMLRLLIEEMIGYCFFRRNELGKCFILTGGGSNGKSTLLTIIKHLIGDDNIASVPLNELSDRFKTYQLEGKLVNIGDDISNEYIPDNSTFKKLVTGETVNVEKKGKDPFDFENYSKLIFSANDPPRINDLSNALKRRLILIPFNAKFSKNDVDFDPFIIDKLLSQESLEYLFNLGLQGLERVLTVRDFTSSKSVDNTWDEYERKNNPVIEFLDDAKVENELTKDIYLQYQSYCVGAGLKSLSKNSFVREVCKLGYKTKQVRIEGKKPYVFVKE